MDDAAQKAMSWLRHWERLINETNYHAARELFSRDVIGFGTLASHMMGLDALEREQWRKIWPTIRNFKFDDPVIFSPEGASSFIIVLGTWRSEGKTMGHKWYDRRGRVTLALESKMGPLLCIHSHFSMEPGVPALKSA